MYVAVSSLIRYMGRTRPATRPDDSDGATNRTVADVLRDDRGHPDGGYLTALLASTPVPPELALRILDYAEVWSCTTATSWPEGQVLSVQDGSRAMVESAPLTTLGRANLRRLVFRITSKDQGWSSVGRSQQGTYEGSCTWHEAQVLLRRRPTEPGDVAEPRGPALELQRNLHAGKQYTDYRIVIEQDHEMMDSLEPGCAVRLDACARYPRWVNNVRHAAIEMQFAATFGDVRPEYLCDVDVDVDRLG